MSHGRSVVNKAILQMRERWHHGQQTGELTAEEQLMYYPIVHHETFSIVPVYDEKGEVCFAFTIGLWVYHHHPELLLIGNSSVEHIGKMIDDLAQRAKKIPISANQSYAINGQSPFNFSELPKPFYKEYMGFASYFYSYFFDDKQYLYPVLFAPLPTRKRSL